jgi:ParB/RepB/Spo0J family partition protein
MGVDAYQEAEEVVAQLREQEEREEQERLKAELAAPPVKTTADHPRVPEMIPLDQIELGQNIRTGELEKVENLALSIKERGLNSPLTVRHSPEGASKPYQLVAGFRRFAALQLLHAGTASVEVRCEVIEGLEDVEIPEMQLLENGQRVQLKPMEVARALRGILNDNPDLTAASVARSLGLKPDWVRRHFRLLELPAEVQGRLETGDLSFTVADLLRRGQKQGKITGDEAKDLAEQVVAGDVTSGELHEMLAPPRPETPLEEAEEGAWQDVDEEERRRDLERQADELLKGPASAEASDDVVFTDWSSGQAVPGVPGGSGSEPTQVSQAFIDAMSKRALDAYLLGRVLEALASEDYLASLGTSRDLTYDYAAELEHAELLAALRALARHLASRDPRLAAHAASVASGDAGDSDDSA